MAEIRLDLLRPAMEEIPQLFAVHGKKLIATCRPDVYSDTERIAILKKAIDSGCGYVDLEVDASTDFLHEMIPYAKRKACKIILSYHNTEKTPDRESLESTIAECLSHGADVVKIAAQTHTEKDAARILSLYAEHKNIVAIGMGEQGKITRIASLLLGAPFTYASPDKGKLTAPGQFTESEMRTIIRLLK